MWNSGSVVTILGCESKTMGSNPAETIFIFYFLFPC